MTAKSISSAEHVVSENKFECGCITQNLYPHIGTYPYIPHVKNLCEKHLNELPIFIKKVMARQKERMLEQITFWQNALQQMGESEEMLLDPAADNTVKKIEYIDKFGERYGYSFAGHLNEKLL